MAQLDFTKIKRDTFDVTLDDEKKTKLSITTPSKALAQRIDAVTNIGDDVRSTDELYAALYGAALGILNNNKKGIELQVADIEACLDVADCWVLINSYRQYVAEQMAANAKN